MGSIMKRLCVLIFFLFTATVIPAFGDSSADLAKAGSANARTATISGQLMVNGKTPMLNGIVFLFDKTTGPPPSYDKYWRVPDLISKADNEGRFLFEVKEGIYYLTAAQKDPNDEMGPPQVEEFHYFHGDANWNALPILITPERHVNLGVLIPFVWSPISVQRDSGITAVEGIVSGMEGKPVEGSLVFAYLSKNITGRPTFVSDKSDKNGKFLLRVNDGGSFFLKVRSVYGGGVPENGEMQNVTKEFESVMVTLEKNQRIKGLQLKVKKFSRSSKNNKH